MCWKKLITLVVAVLLLRCSGSASAQEKEDKDQLYRAAVSAYEAGRYADAVAPLEKLVREVPDTFEVQELLGLVYAAQGVDAKGNEHLAKAVRLRPGSAEARSSLAASYARLGKLDLAQEQFAKAAELDPNNYETNHNLGEIYIRRGMMPQALPYLEKAQRLNSASYDNGYNLSLAYMLTGRLADARTAIQQLLKVKETAELHNLLAQVEEKDGNFVIAANEFQAAARLDPSENNLFDWGGELLLHRTLDPAVQVFEEATKRYPNSARLMVGLGMAYYARGNYDEAVRAFLRGADLDPEDARCYKFLSRAYDSSPNQANEVIERFRRYAELQPGNGRALYYYAMSLWKGKRAQDPTLNLKQIAELLQRAIAADPKLAVAYVQMGNLNSDQGKFAEAIPQYQRALELDGDLVDAHYRLGQAYVRTGQRDKGQEQLAVYQKLREQHLADVEKQRADIRQFVYNEKEPQRP
ncbi:MAG: tetratricopeptide repeat protein [Acidobacteria bacterium]|nr:tetratricopeptide repeat protein [Acidobacteriota bacterium]MBS1864929.1 tetratricopeptide repeat protein [Acidobacteriota bacterium]